MFKRKNERKKKQFGNLSHRNRKLCLIPSNLLQLRLEVSSDRVLIRQEEIQIVILLCLLLAGYILSQEPKRSLIERKVVVQTRLHVLHSVE